VSERPIWRTRGAAVAFIAFVAITGTAVYAKWPRDEAAFLKEYGVVASYLLPNSDGSTLTDHKRVVLLLKADENTLVQALDRRFPVRRGWNKDASQKGKISYDKYGLGGFQSIEVRRSDKWTQEFLAKEPAARSVVYLEGNPLGESFWDQATARP
jgi:hypothetical protein